MSWQIGLATGIYLHQPILDVLPLIGRAGARGVEVSTPPGHFHPTSPDEVERVAGALEQRGIWAVSVHAPFGKSFDLAAAGAPERETAIAGALAAALAGHRLGARLVIVHPSDIERHGQDVAERLDVARTSLLALATAIRQAGMTMVVETPLPHLIGGHPDEFRWLLSHLDRHVGVCLDTGHAALGNNWHRLLNAADGRLMHVHASDNHGERDDHLPPGDGSIDWKAIAASLEAAGYAGWIMLELHGGQATDPESYLLRALAQARAHLAAPSSQP